MKRNPETLALAMDYAAAMESCAAYVAVRNPSVRDPETADRFLRGAQDLDALLQDLRPDAVAGKIRDIESHLHLSLFGKTCVWISCGNRYPSSRRKPGPSLAPETLALHSLRSYTGFRRNDDAKILTFRPLR